MTQGTPSLPTSAWGVMRGVQEVVQLPNPAAGADWSFTVPGGYYRRLLTASALLTTSAGVANRFPSLTITDGQNRLYLWPCVTAMTAGLAVRWSLCGNGVAHTVSAAALACALGIPPLWLPPGYVLSTLTTGIQAGDQWSAVNLWWECVNVHDMHARYGAPLVEVENVNVA